MPFCPKCRYEYVEGVKVCPDCDAELVDKLEEIEEDKPKETSGELVTVAEFAFPIEAQMAKLKLESEGIPCFIANEILSRLDGPIFEYYPVKVQVVEEYAERAAKILRSEHKDKV